MFQGTGSDVGKSLLVAGLCRLFARRGMRVAPFKPQNMSNNAAVTKDGGEIGRAQWLQAYAAGLEPSIHMNPVLLKPQTDRSSQVIVQGKVRMTTSAREYHTRRGELLDAVMESYRYMQNQADLILVEGAGSPAEINLRTHDIANMGFARAANCPVVLVGDIDRGGVIASLVGTHEILPEADRAMICGFLINKFRGDVSLFDEGLNAIIQRTNWQSFGVVPYEKTLRQLPQEDALALEQQHEISGGAIRVVALALPHIANFDDVDPLAQDPHVHFSWLRAGESLPANTQLVIIPGSKATMDDMQFIRAQGWDSDIKAHHRRGGRVLGLCGGYQMLGTLISDPHHVEGSIDTIEGLGLLDVQTVFAQTKTVTSWHGCVAGSDTPVEGYEIHMGQTSGPDCGRPLFLPHEGAVSADGLIAGTYIHGLFSGDAFRSQWLRSLGATGTEKFSYWGKVDTILNNWADILEKSIDTEQLLKISTPQIRPAAA